VGAAAADGRSFAVRWVPNAGPQSF